MVSVAFAAIAATRVWEEVDRLPGPAVEMKADAPDDVYTAVHDGYVYVAVRQKVTIKMFTILGQLIIQDTLPPGIYRYRLTSRGIYLLKAGTVTRRINN